MPSMNTATQWKRLPPTSTAKCGNCDQEASHCRRERFADGIYTQWIYFCEPHALAENHPYPLPECAD
jgi:hypothetical protein